MSAIEAELVKLFKFKKSPEDFEDHQEYLSELVLCVEKIKDDKTWDSMQEETYDWLTEAVEAKNKKREIPDFTDAEPEGAEDPDTVEETTDLPLTDPRNPLRRAPAQETNSEESEPAEVDEETPEEEPEEETIEEVEPEGDSAEPEGAEPAGEVPESEEAEPAKKPRKPRKGAGGKYLKKKKGKPDIQPKNKPGKEPDYKKITGTKDRYGVTEGTKTSMALKMFEKGCTMRDANLELGDNYYVILRKLDKNGHRIEKLENGVLKLTHKDDLSKKGKGK
jgi:hypothetical protein